MGLMTIAIACQESLAQPLSPGVQVLDLLRRMTRTELAEPRVDFVASPSVPFLGSGDSAAARFLDELQPVELEAVFLSMEPPSFGESEVARSCLKAW